MQMQIVFVLFATTSYGSQMYLVLISQGFMEDLNQQGLKCKKIDRYYLNHPRPLPGFSSAL